MNKCGRTVLQDSEQTDLCGQLQTWLATGPNSTGDLFFAFLSGPPLATSALADKVSGYPWAYYPGNAGTHPGPEKDGDSSARQPFV